MDLPCGTWQLKKGGGHAGHNGLRDVMAQLGTPEFSRLRIGIGHPGHKDQVTPYVLSRPSKTEYAAIQASITEAIQSF